jgi:tryptophan 2,3-dioxygenase
VPSLTEEKMRAALSAFDLAGYVEQTRAAGRAQLADDLRDEAGALYRQTCEFRASHSVVSRSLDDALELAQRVLFPEWFLSHADVPRYRAYANVGVLNWYLHTVQRMPYQAIWSRCAVAVRLLLADLIAYEVNSLAGLETRGAGSFDAAAVRVRVEHLRSLIAPLAAVDAPIGLVGAPPPASWEVCLSEPGSALALIHLTAFPQTSEHDEYLFLRAIHIGEACFWGILTATLAAVESLKRGKAQTAAQCLGVALPFAELLTPLFHAVKTMSPERFRRFRDATGNASAVQSRTYQLMQIALTAVNPDTIGVIVNVDELHDLGLYDQPWLTSLAHVAPTAPDEKGGDGASLSESIAALSKALLKWRKLHRGIARIYLADIPEGTGGTSGPSYLKHTVDSTIVAAAETLQRAAADSGSEATKNLYEELWPEEHDIACRVGHAQPVLTSRN